MARLNLSLEKPCSCRACLEAGRTEAKYDPEATDNDFESKQDTPCSFTAVFNKMMRIYNFNVKHVTTDFDMADGPKDDGRMGNTMSTEAGIHLVNMGPTKTPYWQFLAYGRAFVDHRNQL